MRKIFFKAIFLLLSIVLFTNCEQNDKIVFVCSADNDLYHAVAESNGNFQRFSSAEEAVNTVKENAGILVLADNYPDEKTVLPDGFFEKAKAKNVRVYVEFPATVPGISTGEIKTIKWERGVVTSGAFGKVLPEMSILSINDSHYVDMEAENPHLVLARVAGFDKAVYGLDSTEKHPVLFELPEENILVSTTKLSQFITGRYAPKDAWKSVWTFVFHWLQPDKKMSEISWTASVRPVHEKAKVISDKERLEAINRGIDWYYNSNLLATTEEVNKGIKIKISENRTYGKEGIRECYLSRINYDGTQPVSESRRADCASESAMALALHGMMEDNDTDQATAKNMQDYIYFNSNMRKGPRADPQHAEFGFIDWYQKDDLSKGVYYSDDNARVEMGTIVTAMALKTGRWDEYVMANILANFRATSPATGFKPRRLDSSPKSGNTLAKGWKYYHDNKDYYHFAPHYQSWIMAMYLWLYDKTNYEPLLNVAKTGIENMMNAYPHEWHWTNGLQQERARMILPLAWLLRIENTPKHREWLDVMVNDLLSFQDECGAIREEIGSAGHGSYGPPKSNIFYGTSEAPLIQKNGELVADMLYTSNFAFYSLTEAAAVTGDKQIKEAVDKLADFMVRIQVKSETHAELDAAWYRGFDYGRWEYWASNADLGWGVWSTETGWTQGWITTMLMMQEMETNFWDFTAESKISDSFEKYKKLMLADIDKK